MSKHAFENMEHLLVLMGLRSSRPNLEEAARGEILEYNQPTNPCLVNRRFEDPEMDELELSEDRMLQLMGIKPARQGLEVLNDSTDLGDLSEEHQIRALKEEAQALHEAGQLTGQQLTEIFDALKKYFTKKKLRRGTGDVKSAKADRYGSAVKGQGWTPLKVKSTVSREKVRGLQQKKDDRESKKRLDAIYKKGEEERKAILARQKRKIRRGKPRPSVADQLRREREASDAKYRK